MFTIFDKQDVSPEMMAIYQEMKKLANENEELRKRVCVLEERQEALRVAINKTHKKSWLASWFNRTSDPVQKTTVGEKYPLPINTTYTHKITKKTSWF
jgi:hypothetical protein